MDDATSLGQALGPALREECGGCLGPISWFRATWQHGGAATGYSTWTCTSGQEIECVVKLPVGHAEYHWTKRLGLTSCDAWDSSTAQALPTPRVLAAGFELKAYDMAWIVMEKFPGQPIAHNPTGQAVWELFETCAEFQAAAITQQAVQPELATTPLDWSELLAKGMHALEDNTLERHERWIRAVHAAQDRLDDLVAHWASREINTWCHQDLHAGNAMRRARPDGRPGRCVLIDLALVKPGHWVEDALYLERLCWGRETELLCGVDPVGTLAKARAFCGLPVDDEYQALACTRRVLMAAAAPAFLRHEGDPAYLRAALHTLEQGLDTALA